MIVGNVDAEGIPVISMNVGGRVWRAIVDTGCNGDHELPNSLRPHVNARFQGQVVSMLAGGQFIVEDYFQVDLPFSGQPHTALCPEEI